MTKKQCLLCNRFYTPVASHASVNCCGDCIKKLPETAPDNEFESYTPDAKVRIKFYPTAAGGRERPIVGPQFGCPIKIEGKEDELNDCRISIEHVERVYPGDTFTGPIAFLCPDLVAPWLKVGMKFKMWEGRFVADGEVLDVYNETASS